MIYTKNSSKKDKNLSQKLNTPL